MQTSIQQMLSDYQRADYLAAIAGYERYAAACAQEGVRPQQPAILIAAQAQAKSGNLVVAGGLFTQAGQSSDPPNADLLSLGFELARKSGDTWAAFDAARTLLEASPDHAGAREFWRHHLFDFLLIDELSAANRVADANIRAGVPGAIEAEQPHNAVMWCSDEGLMARIADRRQPGFTEESRARRRARPHVYDRKIRIGYVSGDFASGHATMILMRGVLEQHDPERFEVTLYCNTPDAIRANDDGYRATMGHLVSIRDMPDEVAVAAIRADGIDILVDLKGHTRDARPGIFNIGAAPVQLAWLGFPGSAVGVDCDYVIGDPVVTPDASAPHYHEAFCRLPETYQPNDSTHRPLPPPMRRSDAGLPDGRFVFASFNSVRKVSPEVFSAWVRILKAVPESVFWFMCHSDRAATNFADAMAAAGIQRERIIPAKIIGYEPHLARLQAADLCLDTFPCNGHTTTSDCLWAGVPMVAVKGTTFASRVSESLLNAIGLSELVAPDIDGYVELAVSLARNSHGLSGLRQKLAANRLSAPLFNTERFVRHLEKAYEMMVARAMLGLPAAAIDVPALPEGETVYSHPMQVA